MDGAGDSSTSSIEPVSTIAPWYSMPILCPKFLAVARSWVMYMNDMLCLDCTSRMSSSISALIDTSSMDTGSSATMTLGLVARALASTTRCLWPPESMWGYFDAISPAGFEPDLPEHLRYAGRPLLPAAIRAAQYLKRLCHYI